MGNADMLDLTDQVGSAIDEAGTHLQEATERALACDRKTLQLEGDVAEPRDHVLPRAGAGCEIAGHQTWIPPATR